MSEDDKRTDGERLAEQLQTEMPLEDALLVAREATAILHARLEGHIADLTAALGQSATLARRERPAPQQRTPPATPEETVERVREELTRSKRSAKGLASIIRVPLAQVDAALKAIGAEKHGRTFSLRAGA